MLASEKAASSGTELEKGRQITKSGGPGSGQKPSGARLSGCLFFMSLFSTEPNPYLRLLLVKLLFSFVHGSVPVTQDFKKQGVTDYLQELVSGGRLGTNE